MKRLAFLLLVLAAFSSTAAPDPAPPTPESLELQKSQSSQESPKSSKNQAFQSSQESLEQPTPSPTVPSFSQDALDWDAAMLAEVARARDSSAEGDAWRDSLVFASPVMDYAGLLERDDRLALVDRIRALSATNNGAELAVVTLPSLRGGDSKDFATRLFERWGVGAKGRDNGVLFLIAVEERRVEIEPGLGYEGTLPDAKCGRILDRAVVPALKKDNWKAGILGGAEALLAVMSGEDFDKAVSRGKHKMVDLLGWGFFGLVFGGALFTILRGIIRGGGSGGGGSDGSSGGSHHASSFHSTPSRRVSVHRGGGGRSRGGGAGRGF